VGNVNHYNNKGRIPEVSSWNAWRVVHFKKWTFYFN
jgi:hypothetical protein